MISYSKLGSAGGATKYLTAERTDAVAEYYAKEHVPSTWSGHGASYAGIEVGSRVEAADLVKVLEGKLQTPDGHLQQLGRIVSGGEIEHRPGLDLTFSAPKSISIAGLVGDDSRVFAAHEASVERAMLYLESQAATRVRTDNKSIEYRPTGNLVFAKFQHETSRSMDPQLHTHVAVANATFDTQDGKWRSLEYNSLVRDLKAADAIYKNELASNLRELGYKTTWTENGPEIQGVSREQIEQFSKRTAAIDKELESKGMSREEATAAQRSAAAIDTRDKKTHVDRGELLARWRSEAKGVGLDAEQLKHDALGRNGRSGGDEDRAAYVSVKKAIKHLAERDQAFSRNDLVRASNDFAKGSTSADLVEAAIARHEEHGAIVSQGVDASDGRKMFTTPGAIAAEREQVHQILMGKASVMPIMSQGEAALRLDLADATRHYALDKGQRTAAEMILTTTDRFVAVQGYAGAGKTTLLETVASMAESRGYNLVGLANGAEQAHKLESSSGIKSQTVASFFGKLEQSSPSKGSSLWIVDEASQLSQRDWNKLQSHAASSGARIVFVGDKEQHLSVGAGMAFENAQKNGIQTAELTKIYRQKDEVGLAAAYDLVQGRHGDAFDRIISKPGQLVEVRGAVAELEAKSAGRQISAHDMKEAREKDSRELVRQAAKTYLAQENPTKNALIFTATNASRLEINEAVRQEMKQAGMIGQEETKIRSLSDLKLTDQQKAEAWRYKEGMTVQADRGYKSLGVASGQKLTVVGNDQRSNTVTLQDQDGKKLTINPSTKTGFSLYESHEVGMSVGDAVRFTKNNAKALPDAERKADAKSYKKGMVVEANRDYKRAGVSTGQKMTVVSIDRRKNTVTVADKNGKTLTFNPAKKGFSPYERVKTEENKLRNGSRGVVIDVSKAGVMVRTEYGDVFLKKDEAVHLQHRYASTTYKDQGNQAAKGIYVIDTMRPGGVGTRDAYVGMTRAESGTIVLTNDVKRARDLVRQEQGATKAITDALGLSKGDKKADQEHSRKTERTPSFMGEREAKTDQKSEKSADRQPSKSDERQAVRGMSMHR